MNKLQDKGYYIEQLSKFDDKIKKFISELNIIDDLKLTNTIQLESKETIATILSKTDDSDINNDLLNKFKKNRRARKRKVIRDDKANPKSRYNVVNNSHIALNESNKVDEIEFNLKEWANNDDMYISKYLYFEYKTLRFKKTSLLDDCKIQYLYLYLNKKNYMQVEERALSMGIDFPISTTKTPEKLNKQGVYVYDEGTMSCQIKLDKEAMKKGKYVQMLNQVTFSILNNVDISILNFLIKYGSENYDDFFEKRKVEVDVNTIAYNLWGRISDYIKKKIKNSIIKMAYMTIVATSNDKDSKTVIINRPLDNSEYLDKKETEYDYDIIRATINENYIEDIVNGNVITIYSHVLKQLEGNEDAKEAIFKLQKERICYYYKNRNSDIIEPYVKELSYKHFRRYLIMINKRKDQIKKRINKFLDAIIATGEIIEGYRVIGDMYILYFKAFSEEEKRDLNERTEENIKRFL